MPDFHFERLHPGRVCGIDEAGRGPWAGPVVAAAVWLDRDRLPDSLSKGLDDSKALSARRREALAAALEALAGEGAAEIGIGLAEVEEIDRLNILRATLLAMRRAVEALTTPPDWALVDGTVAPPLACAQRCLAKGDSRALSIAAASIIAKTERDRMMRLLEKDSPRYGFDRHFGYGTRAHAEALALHGPGPHHRRSFAPVRKLLHNI